MTSAGIDYGLGQTNINPETGIRYGIISTGELFDWLWEEVEYIFLPRCGHCGDELAEEFVDSLDVEPHPCPHCGETLDSRDDAFSEQPDDAVIDSDGIKGRIDDQSDAWVFESPFYTRGTFCSPCAPGAVTLNAPNPDGPKAYCFPHEWYDGGKAPYPVYRVADDSPVQPTADGT